MCLPLRVGLEVDGQMEQPSLVLHSPPLVGHPQGPCWSPVRVWAISGLFDPKIYAQKSGPPDPPPLGDP